MFTFFALLLPPLGFVLRCLSVYIIRSFNSICYCCMGNGLFRQKNLTCIELKEFAHFICLINVYNWGAWTVFQAHDWNNLRFIGWLLFSKLFRNYLALACNVVICISNWQPHSIDSIFNNGVFAFMYHASRIIVTNPMRSFSMTSTFCYHSAPIVTNLMNQHVQIMDHLPILICISCIR